MEAVGIKVGSLIGLGVVLNIVKNFSYTAAYITLGSIDMIFAFATLFMVAEPEEIEPNLTRDKESKSLKQHLKFIFSTVYATCK